MIAEDILNSFSLDPAKISIEQIGTGHIHKTYKLSGQTSFILQRVNKSIFKKPEWIATNLRVASDFLKKSFPDYYFLTALKSDDGAEMVYDPEGFPWRLYPYRENTITIDKVSSPEEAFSAAREFGRLTKYLDQIDMGQFQETIPQFQDLDLRYRQFELALAQTTMDRIKATDALVQKCLSFFPLVEQYNEMIADGALRLRITHNDTKINNILFDRQTREAVCVIDLDTLMPGYFIYDLGDMVRTFVSSANEEDNIFSKIDFRKDIYDSLLKGYLSQMEEVMTDGEKAAIPFAGKMMTYIMALRFLADYLNGNVYYQIKYPDQNLVRAGNQLKLLEVLSSKF
jgi:Ser/Thr protein kinase RdoA (MazF antagonist)